MKKITALIALLLLSSCFGKGGDLESKKQELLSQDETQTQVEIDQTQNQDTQEDLDDRDTDEAPLSNYYESFLVFGEGITLNPINKIDTLTDKLDISGDVLNPNIDKIEIHFANITSPFPDDSYVLQAFKPGDTTYLYRAYKEYEVFDEGDNFYVIDAYVGDEKVAQIELHVFLHANKPSNDTHTSQDEKEENNTTDETTPKDEITIKPDDIKPEEKDTDDDTIPKLIGDENDPIFIDLPQSTLYGTPLMLGESSFTYSNIDNFEVVKKSDLQDLTCETIGEYLKQTYSWYYWNTCRPIGEESFSVNVLTLKGDEYLYERHYIDRTYNFYATLELEIGTGVTGEELGDKNAELKEQEFPITQKSDQLMKDILH